MEWDTVWKIVSAGGVGGLLALILFGGGNEQRAFWVYGWLYRRIVADLKAERAEKERWIRAWIRLAGSLDKALDKAGMAAALAETMAAQPRRDRDVESDD